MRPVSGGEQSRAPRGANVGPLAPSADMPTETPATVLLIDDDDAIRALLSRELDADGYAPLGAATLTDARRHLQESFPDIAILDTGLPDGSGLTLLGEIRDLLKERRP